MKPGSLLAIALALAYQTVAIPFYRIGSAGPDFVLIVVGYIALYDRGARPLVVAALSGLCVDALSLEPWGTHSLGYATAAGVLALARAGGWGSSALGRFGVLWAAVAVAFLLRLAIVGDASDPRLMARLSAEGLSAALTALASLVAFPLLDTVQLRLVRISERKLVGLRR